ncbi:MAG: competence protein ComEA [Bacteroidia bacterium]|jgi:competence protein ComEA
MLPNWFKEYLSFHKTERRGIFVLVILLIGLIGFNMYQRYFWKSDWESIELQFGEQIIQFEEETKRLANQKETSKPWLPKAIDYFKFDPNKLDSTGWVALGFSPKQSAAVIRYRSAGAVFRKPEDVKKLFVVDDEKYTQLEPFIDIKPIANKPKKKWDKPKYEPKPKWEKPIYAPKHIELNTADSTMLVEVRGIGPFFARVIIEYRDKLGGYRTKQQVLEVYGMDSAKYAKIEGELWVDSTAVSKININTATLKDLVHHPYINFNQAKAIANYRKQHGPFKSVSDLQEIHLVKGETYRKIAPYFTEQ